MVRVKVEAAGDVAVQRRVSGFIVSVPPGETRVLDLNGAQLGQMQAYCQYQRGKRASEDNPTPTHPRVLAGADEASNAPDDTEAEEAWREDYRAAQDKAKSLGIPANQSHADLKNEIEETLEEQ